MTATERPSELRACPFCGQSGDAKVWDGHDPITGMNRGVFCVCGASMRCGEESAKSWNRRTIDAAPADPAPTDSVAIGSKSVDPVVCAGDDIWTCPLPTHWRAALYEARELQEWITTQQAEWIEQRARELAREGK